jgi:hypothetical protein
MTEIRAGVEKGQRTNNSQWRSRKISPSQKPFSRGDQRMHQSRVRKLWHGEKMKK